MKLAEKPRSGGIITASKLSAAGVALLSLAAMIYPLSLADSMGYWYDEIWSVDAALGDFARMLQLLAGDVHPPLYHALLWLWVRVFGAGESATRLFSILALAGAVPFVFLTGRRLGLGVWASAAAAGATGFCYTSLVFALETRPYTFLLFSTALTTWLLLRATNRRGYLWAWLGGVCAALIHYAAFFYLLPLALLLAMRDRDRRKLVLAAAWIAALAPFFWVIRVQAALFATFTWLSKPVWADLNNYFTYAMADLRGFSIVAGVWCAAVGLALIRRELRTRLWLMLVPLIVASVVAVSYAVMPIFHVRYLYAMQPWYYLTAAYLVNSLPHAVLRAAGATALVLIVLFGTLRSPVTKPEDWRAAAHYVQERRKEEPIMTTTGARWYRVYFPDIEIVDENDAQAAMEWLRKNAGRKYWMLQARDFGATPARKTLADSSDIILLEEFAGSRAMLLEAVLDPTEHEDNETEEQVY